MVLLVCASAAADEKPAASRTYVGVLDGAPKNSLIAVVVEGNEVLAYACSEDEKFNATNGRWFRAAAADGKLQAANDGVRLDAAIGQGAVTGTLTGPDKKGLKFTATPAGEHRGLFRAEGKVEDQEHVAGWIADGRGTVVGSQFHKQFVVVGVPSFHHVQTFKFPTNHAFHQDFNFNKHFHFQQGSHHFHAQKVFHVPPHGGKR
jgi:hypothetical protein